MEQASKQMSTPGVSKNREKWARGEQKKGVEGGIFFTLLTVSFPCGKFNYFPALTTKISLSFILCSAVHPYD